MPWQQQRLHLSDLKLKIYLNFTLKTCCLRKISKQKWFWLSIVRPQHILTQNKWHLYFLSVLKIRAQLSHTVWRIWAYSWHLKYFCIKRQVSGIGERQVNFYSSYNLKGKFYTCSEICRQCSRLAWFFKFINNFFSQISYYNQCIH